MTTAFQFCIEQGADWSRLVTFPLSINGYSATLTISDINGPFVLTLSTANGLALISGTGLLLSLPNATTSTLLPGYYQSSLVLTDASGNATEWLQGLLLVSAGTAQVVSTATHFVLSVASSVLAGSNLPYTVTCLNSSNTTVTNYTGTVVFTSSDSLAILPPPATLTSGIGSFSAVLGTFGTQTLTASDSAFPITGSASATVTVGPRYFVVNWGVPTVTSGIGHVVTVFSTTGNGIVDTTYNGTVKFTSSDSQAIVPANSQLTSGLGVFSATLLTTGRQTLTATDTLVSSVFGRNAPLTVVATAFSKYGVNAPTPVATSVPFKFTATAQDRFGNYQSSFFGFVNFSASDTAAVLPASSVMFLGKGVYTATLSTVGNQTITVTDAAVSSITGASGAINVATVTYSFTGPGTGVNHRVTAGLAASFTLTAVLVASTYTAYTGTVIFTSSDSKATLPSNSTLSSGVGVFSLTNCVAPSVPTTLSATDTLVPAITGHQNSNVVQGRTTSILVALAPSQTTGVGFSWTVSPLDVCGNLQTGYTGTVNFSSSDTSAVLPASGVLGTLPQTLSATLNTAGNQTITVRDSVTSSVTGQGVAQVIQSGSTVPHFVITQPGTLLNSGSGQNYSFTATCTNPNGTTNTAYTGTATLSVPLGWGQSNASMTWAGGGFPADSGAFVSGVFVYTLVNAFNGGGSTVQLQIVDDVNPAITGLSQVISFN